VRRQLQDKERQLTSGQAAVRDTETRLQELRSKIAGYEDTQQAYQASGFVHLVGPHEPCSPCLAQHKSIMRGKTGGAGYSAWMTTLPFCASRHIYCCVLPWLI